MKYPFSKNVTAALLCGISIGIVLALSFTFIRYTGILPPRIVDIDPKDAYQQILDTPNDIILIDVRSEYEYAQAHASSSVNLPIHYMYDDTHGVPNEKKVPLPKNKDKEIYLLCTGGRLAGVAYSYLEHYGYRNIKRIEGGLKNWNEQGMPIITKSLFGGSYSEKSFDTVSTSPLDRSYDTKTPR